MADVIETIRRSRPDADDLSPLDIERIARRARRGDVAGRIAVAAVALVAVAGFVAVLDVVVSDRGVYVGPGEPGAEDGQHPATGEVGQSEEASESAEPDGLDAAIEQLIEANRRAEPRPVADEAGEVLIERTYAIWTSATGGGEGATYELEVTWYESRTDAEGRTEIVRKPLATLEPTDDLAELRDAAQPYFANSAPPEDGETLPGVDPRATAEEALEQAERDSRGTAEPAPGRTERPDQAQAFILAADALRMGLQPEHRIRALGTIGRLDPSLVEYRGTVLDLLGREGIGIAGRDGDIWNVLIFDPETGDVLGEYSHMAEGAETDTPPIMSYTARETVLRPTGG